MCKYIWIGKCESDIRNAKHLFCSSITLYGSNKAENYAFYECQNVFDYKLFIEFIIEKIILVLHNYPDAKLYFYNQQWAIDITQEKPDLKSIIVNFNNSNLIHLLNNKSMCRQWISTTVAIPPFIVVTGMNCSIEYLTDFFSGYKSFVIQENISEGGEGTFLLNEKSKECIKELLNPLDFYVAAPYLSNSISLNATVLIKDKKYIIFPISEQLIKIGEDTKKLIFNGSDFISGHEYEMKFYNLIHNFLTLIINYLVMEEYNGIFGIDFIIHNDKAYFIEINPRFQGSSFIIDELLYQNIGKSLYEINLLSSEDISEELINSIKNINPLYSYVNNNDSKSFKEIKLLSDGSNISLNRRIYNTKISLSNYEYTSNDYYNFFAKYYHTILPDWEEAINSEGIILKQIIEKYSKIRVNSILDCTCGIGVQTISLAMLGVNICGSDISVEELNIARNETKKRNLDIEYFEADCRDLSKTFQEKFDAIISIDSAMPHLLTAENFIKAFTSIYNQLQKGGVFLASFRDYDSMLKQKPEWAYEPRVRNIDNKTIIVLRRFEWEQDICTSHQYYIENINGEANMLYNTYKQWAIKRDRALELAKELPFSESLWLFPEESGFYQPILCLIK